MLNIPDLSRLSFSLVVFQPCLVSTERDAEDKLSIIACSAPYRTSAMYQKLYKKNYFPKCPLVLIVKRVSLKILIYGFALEHPLGKTWGWGSL